MNDIAIGLIGTGFMGKCHALAFRAVSAVFPDVPTPRLELLADVDPGVTSAAAKAFGFARWTTDWRALVTDPAIDLVAITAPNFLHQEMALAAIEAGKHVYCEKPLALSATGARHMTSAAEAAGVKTLVGYNYLHGPATVLAKEIIDSGEIGEVVQFRGTHFEDYMADPTTPHSWRCRKETSGAGAIADLGSHVISLARHLVGEIDEVFGEVNTVIRERPLPDRPDARAPVDVDDQAEMLLRFANGAAGSAAASWIASGRKMYLTYQITGTKGTLVLDHERVNELQLFTTQGPKRLQGFTRLLMGPEHGHYAAFCPAPGHGLGFNELKVIEVRHLLDGIGNGTPLAPDFRSAWRIAQVIDAAQLSAREGCWVRPEEV